MNLDDMKQNWRERNDKLAADGHFDQLAADVKTRSARFEAAIVRRDQIEAAAAIFVISACGFFLWCNALPRVMALGIALMMLAAVEIIAVMYWARHRDSHPRQDSSILEFSEAEIARVDRQIGLLRKISWWYSAPMLLGMAVFMFGLMMEVSQLPRLKWFGFLGGFFLCFVWAGSAIHRINQRAVNNELVPLRDQIAEFLDALSPATPATDHANGNDKLQQESS